MKKAKRQKKTVASGKIYHAHDRSIKVGLKDIRIAKDFFKHHLPEKIQTLIQLDTLRLEDGVFVDRELKGFETDILYAVELANTAEQKIAYLFLHLEHLSEADWTISFRIVQYAVKILDRHLKNHPEQKQLPLIIPLVLYNGEKPFAERLSVFELFGEHEDLARQYMFNTFHLVDLNSIPDEEIRRHHWASLLEMIFKHIHSRNLMTILEAITDIFQRCIDEQAEDYVISMLKYIIEKSHIEDRQQFLNWVVKNLPPRLEKDTMTLAQQWKQEGLEQGMQQGIQQGMQQAREREKAVIINLLKERFNSIPQSILRRIEVADSETLLSCTEKILKVKTIEEIFESYH